MSAVDEPGHEVREIGEAAFARVVTVNEQEVVLADVLERPVVRIAHDQFDVLTSPVLREQPPEQLVVSRGQVETRSAAAGWRSSTRTCCRREAARLRRCHGWPS